MDIDYNAILKGKNKPSSCGMCVAKLASCLLHSREQVHIAHLQTSSYAKHKALNDYYDEVVDLVDRLVESAQGRLGQIITGYTTKPIQDNIDPITYFNTLLMEVEMYRKDLEYPFLEQVCDEIIELICSTKYKLEQLS